MNLYNAKKAGVTEKGNLYSILQDGPNSFHVTVQKKVIIDPTEVSLIYEHYQDLSSLEELDKNVVILEEELLVGKKQEVLTSDIEHLILPEQPINKENENGI